MKGEGYQDEGTGEPCVRSTADSVCLWRGLIQLIYIVHFWTIHEVREAGLREANEVEIESCRRHCIVSYILSIGFQS